MSPRAVAGVFVGGRSERMDGRPKGLLRGPDGLTLVERWAALLGAMEVPVVLVGRADDYATLGLKALPDAIAGVGPLGGLVALLRHAGERPALALACDMPFVSAATLERLLAAPSEAPVVAPRREGRWEPLCARYEAARVLPAAEARAAAGQGSLRRLLDEVGAVALSLSPEEHDQLRDWDSPEDVAATAS